VGQSQNPWYGRGSKSMLLATEGVLIVMIPPPPPPLECRINRYGSLLGCRVKATMTSRRMNHPGYGGQCFDGSNILAVKLIRSGGRLLDKVQLSKNGGDFHRKDLIECRAKRNLIPGTNPFSISLRVATKLWKQSKNHHL